MKKNLLIAVWFTLVTTVMFGLIYPLGITALAQLCFHDRADGQLISKNGKLVGSRIIGQAFTGPAYFHSRPSNAGTGYDSTSSGGSNLAPTNKNLLERVKRSEEHTSELQSRLHLVCRLLLEKKTEPYHEPPHKFTQSNSTIH